jgi:hypothetical protein
MPSSAAAGLALVLLSVWGISQIWGGNALERLGI